MTHPLYLIEASFGRLGKSFIETDRDVNSRAHVIELIRSGEVNAFKVIEVCEDEGTVRDVTSDILEEVEALANDDLPIDEPREWAFDHSRDLRKHGETAE
jgi:hypothetical protein